MQRFTKYLPATAPVVATVLVAALSLSACEEPKPVPVTIGGVSGAFSKAAISGKPQNVGGYYALNPDCTPMDLPTVRVVGQPLHGSVTVVDGTGYTWYGKDNQRFECNKQQSAMRQLIYTSAPGFLGMDTFRVSVVYADGNHRDEQFNVLVQ